MKCKECNTLLLSLYHREGAGGKRWVKLEDFKYCKKCKKMYKIKEVKKNEGKGIGNKKEADET